MRTATLLILCIALLSPAGVVLAGDIDTVRALVFAWSKAWQNRDIDRYMSFYSPAFKSKGLGYESWKKKKAVVFRDSRRIRMEMYDLWVFIEGKYAIARFVQSYDGQTSEDTGEKTLLLVKPGDTWQIVSEEWKPLVIPKKPVQSKESKPPVVPERPFQAKKRKPSVIPAKQTQGGRKAGTIARLDPKTQPADPSAQGDAVKSVKPEKTVVKNITFEIENDLEKVFVGLDQFTIPRVLTLGGNKPRIVLDIMNVSSWKGRSKIPVNGKIIRQIRTHLHREIEKLRIVLDLMPAKNYIIEQTFYRAKNIYCIAVQ